MIKKLQTEIDEIICRALDEDLGDGDLTSQTIIPEDEMWHGRFLVKESGIVAGLHVAALAFWQLDKRVQFTPMVEDGDLVESGTILAELVGPGRALLGAERVALNFLQRMSGIATMTRQYVTAVADTHAIILDTRKTAPGLRVLDKLAVKLGGGQNHRFGLFDMALIKENHIAAAGGIAEAVRRVRTGDGQNHPIEVEVTNLSELEEALPLNVDRIMLDNMSLVEMREAVVLVNGRAPLEASGNITLKNVAQVAATGVDFISTGALTHSVRALDISFELASLN